MRSKSGLVQRMRYKVLPFRRSWQCKRPVIVAYVPDVDRVLFKAYLPE